MRFLCSVFLMVLLAHQSLENPAPNVGDNPTTPTPKPTVPVVTTVTTPKPTVPPPTTVDPLDDKVILNALINRGKRLIDLGRTTLQKFRLDRNYFSSSLEKELLVLIKFVERLTKEQENFQTDNPFFKEFLYQAEAEVNRHSQRLTELIELGKKGTDAAYVQLLHLIDALVQRAYADVGYLYLHDKTDYADTIKEQVLEIKELEKQLKSVDFKVTPDLAEKVVEKILEFERKLQEELFKIEEDIRD